MLLLKPEWIPELEIITFESQLLSQLSVLILQLRGCLFQFSNFVDKFVDSLLLLAVLYAPSKLVQFFGNLPRRFCNCPTRSTYAYRVH